MSFSVLIDFQIEMEDILDINVDVISYHLAKGAIIEKVVPVYG